MTLHSNPVGMVLAQNPVFPPSFDDNAFLFGWALFARLMVLMLASATVVRLVSRTRVEALPCNHPVFYHRAAFIMVLVATMLGSGADVITYLPWGEVQADTMARYMTAARIMDGLTVFPFTMALFVPLWVAGLGMCAGMPRMDSFRLSGAIHDIRTTWPSAAIPLRLAGWCAFGASLVTLGKWAAWYGIR